MLRLAAEAGLRRAEIAQVHSSHLDAQSRQILVHGKGGKQRIVPGHLSTDRVGRSLSAKLT
jgi:integrase/recombinase XerC